MTDESLATRLAAEAAPGTRPSSREKSASATDGSTNTHAAGVTARTQRWWQTGYWQRVVMWCLFGCLASLLPLLIQMLHGFDSPRGATFDAICGDGELLVISAVLAAGALGEVILGIPRSMLMLVLTFGCGAELVVASLWFADIRGRVGSQETTQIDGQTVSYVIKAHSVAVTSLEVFIATVVTCAFALYWASKSARLP
jgi:hypothetical protein